MNHISQGKLAITGYLSLALSHRVRKLQLLLALEPASTLNLLAATVTLQAIGRLMTALPNSEPLNNNIDL